MLKGRNMKFIKSNFSGTVRLARFIARGELKTTIIWSAILVFMTSVVAFVFDGLFSTPEELLGLEIMMRNPAMIAMMGPLYPVDGIATIGGIFTNSMLLYTILAACVMNVFLVIRNTRADEEMGRGEVIRSLPVGKLSTLASTMIVAVVINTLLALLTGVFLGLTTVGIESMSFGGAMLYGAAIGVSGLMFAGVAAVCSQASRNSRGAIGLSMLILGIFYIIRAPGDMAEVSGGSGALAMISPFGIITRTQVFSGNRFWPISVILVISMAFVALAFYLNAIRDLDQGLIPARKGRGEASKLFKYPIGLALKLIRTSTIIWIATMLFLGIAYGSVLETIPGFVEGNEMLEQMLGGADNLSKGYLATILSLMPILAAVPVVGILLKPFNEEKNHRMENIVSKAVSRQRILTDYIIIAVITSFIMLFSLILGIYIAAVAVMENPFAFGELFSAAMAYLPSVLAVVGIAALLGGLFPQKANTYAYAILGFSVAVSYLGPMILQKATWIKYFTPFGYAPKLLIESVDTMSFLLMGAIFLVGIAAAVGGFVAYCKRDLV